jgi:hypothetical protein
VRFTEPNENYNRAARNMEVVNDTELRWNADPESDVVGYEIVWRDCAQPLWIYAMQVSNVTDFTLTRLNKNDFHLASARPADPGNGIGDRHVVGVARDTHAFVGGVVKQERPRKCQFPSRTRTTGFSNL